MPKASIIIPFYNQGVWLKDAVESALSQDFEDFDILLVDDGSTDPRSRRIFDGIEDQRVRKIRIPNGGLANARNTAIEASSADYILPLDSDDRIAPSYLRKVVDILDSNREVGIVSCDVELFGEAQGSWKAERFSFPEILTNPQIMACSAFRRSDWQRVGGYKSDMIYGWEDYEFWLSLIELGVEVYHIPESLFFYRQTKGSMAGLEPKQMLYSFRKLFEHHRALYENHIEELFKAVIAFRPYRERAAGHEVFQLYLPDPVRGGYSANGIREQSYPAGVWSRICFDLFDAAPLLSQALRLDPGESLGLFDVASFKVVDSVSGQALIVANDAESFAAFTLSGTAKRIAHPRFLRILNTGGDPVLHPPILESVVDSGPVFVEIWVRFRPNLADLPISDTMPTDEGLLTQAKVRDLERSLAFFRERELALQFQELELKGEIQRLQSELVHAQAEAKSQFGVAKSIQGELYALQADHKALMEQRDRLRERLNASHEK